MKFTYNFIKENIRIYNEAKSILPIISEYERGEVTLNSMRLIKLGDFADFYNFTKSQEDLGFSLIGTLSYRELKLILSEKSNTERHKTYFKNRPEKQFRNLIEVDYEKFDKLLNGTWKTKPAYRRNGRRANNSADALNIAFTPIINWIISNDIDVCNKSSQLFGSFVSQPAYQYKIKWYNQVVLDLSVVPKREIDITTNLLTSLVDFIGQSNIDFRKLNSDFIVESLQSKVRTLMEIPVGSSIRAINDVMNSNLQSSILTKGKDYTVISSYISNGFVKVLIADDSGSKNYQDYRNFEDVALNRDLLLKSLGII